MIIKTTINIRRDLFERIVTAAEQTGVTTGAVVSALLRHFADRAVRREAAWCRVRYQRRQPGVEWKRMHFQPCMDEYEYCIDLRKVLKFSVSCLVAYAVEHFLDELIARWGEKIDNYHFHNYAMSQFNENGVSIWIYYWGIPQKLMTHTQ
ncbi:MAG: hypothetical protein KBA61_02000 [Spirochaetes bacterium]|nr:hypothetical protein [Spirochaetota bacterium]